MTKIMAIFYILSTLYSSSPDMQPGELQNLYLNRISTYYQSDANSAIPSDPANPPADEPSSGSLIPAGYDPSTTGSTPVSPLDIICSEELKKLGFLKEESTDKNLNLRNAVIRFQSSCNMDVTGVWDDSCMNALINRLGDPAFSYPDTITNPPSTSKWITINKTKRILTLYENTTVIRKYPVAIGNPTTLTPNGKFTIVSRVINPVWGGGGYAKAVKGGSPKNPLGYRWMGLSYGNGSRLGIHGNNSPNSIGRNISHGCIRMINSDVEELFKQVAVKTPVWIGSEKELVSWGITQEDYCTSAAGDF